MAARGRDVIAVLRMAGSSPLASVRLGDLVATVSGWRRQGGRGLVGSAPPGGHEPRQERRERPCYTLSIGARRGTFSGMPSTRTFRVIVVSPGRAVGFSFEPVPQRTVQFTRDALDVALD